MNYIEIIQNKTHKDYIAQRKKSLISICLPAILVFNILNKYFITG